MNSHEIAAIISVCPLLYTNFLGIFPADRFPAKTTIPLHSKSFCIINTDPSHKVGAHWCLFMYNGDHKALEYFDSYGMPAHFYWPKWETYMYSFHSTYRRSRRQIQDLFSNVCASHCLTVAHLRLLGNSFEKIIHSFYSTDTCANDKLSMDYIKTISRNINIYKNLEEIPYTCQYMHTNLF